MVPDLAIATPGGALHPGRPAAARSGADTRRRSDAGSARRHPRQFSGKSGAAPVGAAPPALTSYPVATPGLSGCNPVAPPAPVPANGECCPVNMPTAPGPR